MKWLVPLLLIMCFIIPINLATEWSPQGNVNGRGIYSIHNFINITANNFINGQLNSDLNNITVISSIGKPLSTLKTPLIVKTQNRLVYVGADESFWIIDASNVSAPRNLGYISSTNLDYIRGMEVVGKYVFVQPRDANRFVIIDVSNPMQPFIAGMLSSTAVGGHEFVIKGKYVITTKFSKDNISVVDISDPLNPTLINTLWRGGANGAHSVITWNDYVISSSLNTSGIYTHIDIFNATDVTNLVRISGTNLSVANAQPHQIAIKGDYLYAMGSVENYLYVLDLSNITKPTEIAALNYSSNFSSCFEFVFYNNNILCAARNITGNHSVIGVIDVLIPSNPYIKKVFFINSSNPNAKALGIDTDGKYAYVVETGSNLTQIIDLQNGIKTGQIVAGFGEFDKLTSDKIEARDMIYSNNGFFWNLYGQTLSGNGAGLTGLDNQHKHDGANITSGTIAFARLPTLTDTHTHDAENITSGTLAFARLPSLTDTHTHDTGNLTNVAYLNDKITLQGENITGGTVADARIASTIARDSEVAGLYMPLAGGSSTGTVTYAVNQGARYITDSINNLGIEMSGNEGYGVHYMLIRALNFTSGAEISNKYLSIFPSDGYVAINVSSISLPAPTFEVNGDGRINILNVTDKLYGNSTWQHQSYPVACPENTSITQLGDSVVCTDYWINSGGDTMIGDLNMSSNNITNVNYIYANKFVGSLDTSNLTNIAYLNNKITITSTNITDKDNLADTHTHNASNITSGTFGAGDFVFPSNLNVTSNLTVGTNALFVDGSANRVGIGTSSPTAYLDIQKPGSSKTFLRINDTSATSDILIDLRGSVSSNSKYIQGISLSATGQNFTILGDASLGLGTTSPAAMIHAVKLQNSNWLAIINNTGTSGANGLLVQTGGTAGGTTAFLVSTATAPNALIVDGTGLVKQIKGSAGSYGSLNSRVANVIESSNQFGTVLQIISPANSTNPSYSGIFLGDNNTISGGQIQYVGSTHTMTFSTASSPRMVIDSTGNVAIGTQPLSTNIFTIQGTAPKIFINATTGTNRLYTQYRNTGAYFNVGIDSNDGAGLGTSSYSAALISSSNMSFVTGETGVDMFIGNTGNVGIGTTSPSNKLHVVGNANITGNVTAQNVFLPSYIFSHTNRTMAVGTGGTWYNVSFDEVADTTVSRITHTFNDGTNNSFTIVDSGIYRITYSAVFQDSDASPDGFIATRIIKNDAEITGSLNKRDTSKQNADIISSHVSFLISLNTGDVLKLQFIADDTTISLASGNIYGDHSDTAKISIQRIA